MNSETLPLPSRRGGKQAKPPITLSTADEERLSGLAASISRRDPELAGHLLSEIDRARLLPPGRMPPDVVAMHSHVEYRDGGTGTVRRVQLVYPHEADIAAGRVSVLTLVGTALLGMAAGRSILWPTQQGHERVLTVLRVSPEPFGITDD